MNLAFPLLEQFCFRRIVYDEFHESDSFGSKEVHCLVNLRALAKWGLTGTPQQQDARAVVAAASLFGVDLAGQSAGEAVFANHVAFCSRNARDVLFRGVKKNPQFCLDESLTVFRDVARNVGLERDDEYSFQQDDQFRTSYPLNLAARFWPCVACGERNPLPDVDEDLPTLQQTGAKRSKKRGADARNNYEFTCVHCHIRNHAPDMLCNAGETALVGKHQLQRFQYQSVHAWDRCASLARNAQLFCERYMRQNSFASIVDGIKVVEKVVQCRLTKDERLLYEHQENQLSYSVGGGL